MAHELGHKIQRRHVARPDDGEVPMIQRCQGPQSQPFREGNQRGVDHTERKVAVLLDEVGGAAKVGYGDLVQGQLLRKGSQKGGLGDGSEIPREEVADLGNDGSRDEQRSRRAGEELDTPAVIGVVAVGESDERPGVDQDHRLGNSAPRIASAAVLRSERPLRPTPVKLSRVAAGSTPWRSSSSNPRRTPSASTRR